MGELGSEMDAAGNRASSFRDHQGIARFLHMVEQAEAFSLEFTGRNYGLLHRSIVM